MEISRIACLYRVSTKNQLDDNDIPMQKKACLNFIKEQKNWVLCKEYSEKGVSGYHKSQFQRDVLQTLKSDVDNNEFDILLVFMFDRLGRREDETPFIVEWLIEKGVRVFSVVEGEQKLDNRVDKLLNYIRYWQSAGESEKTSQRVSEKHRQMVLEGKFRGGGAPFGYKLKVSLEKNKKGCFLSELVIDFDESLIVKKIFNYCGINGFGGKKIALLLNESNIKTKKGNRFTSATVLNILKNEIYKGHFVYGKTKRLRGKKIKQKEDSWIKSEFLEELAIIDDTTWQKANEIIKSRQKKDNVFPMQTKNPFLLSGLVYCLSCGKKMSYRYNKKSWVLKNGEKKFKTINQYFCNNKNCTGQKNFLQEKIDLVVLNEIDFFIKNISKDLISKTLKEFNDKNNCLKKHEFCLCEIQKIKKELEALKEEITNSILGTSKFNKDDLANLIFEKEKKIKILESQYSKENEFLLETYNLSQIFLNSESTFKKMFIFLILDGIYVTQNTILIVYKNFKE